MTEKEKTKLKKMKAAAIDSDDEEEGLIYFVYNIASLMPTYM